MTPLLDMSVAALTALLGELGQPPYRAGQVLRWVWRRGVFDFAAMTDLPEALRGQLAQRLTVRTGRVVTAGTDADGTTKLLLELPDGARVETVRIPSPPRYTACVSTQVGCALGCGFCASTQGGLARNLTAGEIAEQTLALRQATGDALTHVVFMGVGEPLANYDATVAAIRMLQDPARGAISARRMTVSTVGLPDGIRSLAGEGLPVTLALSLHAPTQDVRRQIIPAAERWPLDEVLSACADYFARTGRRVTLEYVLLAGVNDAPAQARALAAIARRLGAQINLLAYNPVASLPYQRPSPQALREFQMVLEQAGANVQLRRSRGLAIDAACGQLRRRTP